MNSENSIEKLIGFDEGAYVEFKVEVDLDSKEGKAKFLKEVLALANSATIDHPSFLVIGVEDKSKKIVGTQNIPEEKIQQIIERFCKPPIPLSFQMVDYQGKKIGVVQIFFSSRKPHTFSSPYGYKNSSDGKDKIIPVNVVFVRRGSKVGEASVEEIVLMAQENSSETEFLAQILAQVENMNYGIRDISNSINEVTLRNTKSNTYVEDVFVSIIIGVLFGFLWLLSSETILFLLPLIGIVISVILSALKVVQYGLLRAIASGFLFGALTLIFNWYIINPYALEGIFQMDLVNGILIGSIVGAISGIIGTYFISRVDRFLRIGM